MSNANLVVNLVGIPIPPTSNTQYKLVRRGRKTYHVPSESLKIFNLAMSQYPYLCKDWIVLKHRVHQWRQQGFLLEVRAVYFFHRRKLFSKDLQVKKLDVSNRIKALHDSLARLLNVDDCFFFRITAEKAVTSDQLNEMVCVEILPLMGGNV